MESYEEIKKKHLEHVTQDLDALVMELLELGWTREQILAHIMDLLDKVESDEGAE